MSEFTDAEAQIVDDIAGYHHDPLGFVLYAFPWGEPGELADHKGPREWQRQELIEVGEALAAGASVESQIHHVIQRATASGHGIGKSALVSWIVLFAMSTMEDTRGVVTANTEAQLRTKTWPELAKWHRLAINSHWFRFTATAIFSADPTHEKTWRIDALPWSEHRPEAFAGLHNQGRRILVVFDEASAVPDVIWQVIEGALTDEGTEILWLAYGNPTRNTGRFRECFGKLGHRWAHRQIDSRDVEGTNKQQIAKWVEDYGEDSDFVRVRVRGMFPRAGSMQFIPSDTVAQAAKVEPQPMLTDPLVIGVDVARFGDDQTVITFRRGRDARTLPTIKLRGVDGMTLAGRLASLIDQHKPHAVFIDETGGYGGGPIDRLRQLGYTVIGVNFGARADGPVDGVECANKSAEMWAKMRQWLKEGGAIEADSELCAELEGREFGYDVHNRIVLERKDDMKKRGLASPDCADALALTFAHPVAAIDLATRAGGRTQGRAVTESKDYDPFA